MNNSQTVQNAPSKARHASIDLQRVEEERQVGLRLLVQRTQQPHQMYL
jgi:hypothetical protein